MPKPLQFSLNRMMRAVEDVRIRLLRSTAALEKSSVLYAVVGGNAVAWWVSQVDPAAIRNTPDVNILIRRDDFGRAQIALDLDGFLLRDMGDAKVFLEATDAPLRGAVRFIFAKEQFRSGEDLLNPDVTESYPSPLFRVLSLQPLVRTKLTAFRDVDRVHLRDLIGVGLVDATWPARFSPELAQRLQSILDTPNG